MRILFFLLLSVTAPLAEPVQLGIAEFETHGYGARSAAATIRAALEGEFMRAPGLALVDRQHLQTLLEEVSFQQSGVTRGGDALGLGEFANVHALLFGEVSRPENDRVPVTFRLVDVATGKVLLVEQAQIPKNALSRGGAVLGKRIAALVPGIRPAEMVTIASIEGTMGSDATASTSPARRVRVDSFAIDRLEVSRAAYALFAHRSRDDYEVGDDPLLPATMVSWHDADSYCREQGKRLPTEAEWELAARGSSGRPYPWGSQAPTRARARFGAPGPVRIDARAEGATPEGVEHLAGNVAEWVSDWYDPAGYGTHTVDNPQGPMDGEYKVIRGGSYADPAIELAATVRGFHTPMRGAPTIGFRCARSLP